MLGQHPFAGRDKATNVWPLAILSLGESWHNLHHAHRACARHGVRRGQLDISARVIWNLETLGWAREVRWPTSDRLARLSTDPTALTRRVLRPCQTDGGNRQHDAR